MEENRQLQLVAIVSSLCSAFVVLTLILFPSMRERLFMRIISFISLSDLLGNIPYMTVIRPASSSSMCKFSGFINLYFYPVTWMWTTTLVYFLYGLAINGRVPMSELSVHGLCWGVPLILTLLVLTTNDYGRFDENDDNEVCTVGGDENSAFAWRIVIYYGLFLSCVFTMGYLYLKIIRIKRIGLSSVSEGMLNLAVESLSYYPVAMIVSWIPEFISFIIQFDHHNGLATHVSAIFKLANGVFMAVIFFSKSQHARLLWYRLLTNEPYHATRDISHDSSCCLDILDEYGFDSERKISLLSETSSLYPNSHVRIFA